MGKRILWIAIILATAGAAFVAARAGEVADDGVPVYEVDPSWPKPLPNNWILGQISGVAVDSRDHVWIVQRPLTLTDREAGAVQDPPLSLCCVPAPSIIEFDREGNVVQAWGGPDSVEANAEGGPVRAWIQGERWPQSEHGIFVDHQDNVWMGSNGRLDQVVLKFDRSGRRLLTIGEWEVSGGSGDTEHLGSPADIAVDQETNEVYIADGYRNRRIIVFDAETGAYKRHWGAYGERPDDGPLPPYDPDAEPIRSFRSPMHAVRIADDGLVYAADRVNNRIQVFRKDGTFVREAILAPRTLAMGSVWDLELSPDARQTWLFIPDGTNMRYAGQLNWAHNAAVDSEWNLYVTEVNTGKRVQRYVRR
jgi:hypothetical protein